MTATVAEDLRDCRPTVFFAVPHFWEKLHEAVLAKLAHAAPISTALVRWFHGIGLPITEVYGRRLRPGRRWSRSIPSS